MKFFGVGSGFGVKFHKKDFHPVCICICADIYIYTLYMFQKVEGNRFFAQLRRFIPPADKGPAGVL